MKLGDKLIIKDQKKLIIKDSLISEKSLRPELGKFNKLTDDIYWAKLPLPFRLDHINVFLIDSIEGLIIIDCGIKNEVTEKNWEKLLRNLPVKKEITKIIVSHHHPDHIGFAKVLSKKIKANVYAPKIEYLRSKTILNLPDHEYGNIITSAYKKFGFSDEFNSIIYNQGNYYSHLVKELPDFIPISLPYEIKTNNGVWKGRFDTGHSPSQLSFYDEKRKLFLCIDFLLPRITPNISVGIENIDQDILIKYFEYLESIQKMDEDWLVIPSHEYAYYDPVKRAKNLIIHHNNRLKKILSIFTDSDVKNVTTSDVLKELFGDLEDNHEIFHASCEARSHLNYLISKQQLVKSVNDEGVEIYNRNIS